MKPKCMKHFDPLPGDEMPEEAATNDLIAVIWPMLDAGIDRSEVEAIFRNVMDSYLKGNA